MDYLRSLMSEEHNRYMRKYKQRPKVKVKIAKYMREYRKRPEVAAKRDEKKRLYKQRPEVKEHLRIKRSTEEERFRNSARNLTNRMIADGRLSPSPCEVCGQKKVDAHHEDYRKPSSVRWLCHKHHSEFHNGA